MPNRLVNATELPESISCKLLTYRTYKQGQAKIAKLAIPSPKCAIYNRDGF